MIIMPVQEHAPIPRWYQVTVIAQDPTVRKRAPESADRTILTAKVSIPADWLAPGPRSHRFHVVDYDGSSGGLTKPMMLLSPESERSSDPEQWRIADNFAEATDAVLLGDRGFHAQNLFAVAARTLSAFETNLGRRVSWSFDNHQLFLVPHAMIVENAFYSAADEAIFCGYFFDNDGGRVDTCLSHDVIAHETTHAVLDGIFPRLVEPDQPDQLAFHEGFADIVALLSVFSIPEVVAESLPKPDRNGQIKARDVTEEKLTQTALFALAEQWGDIEAGRSGLRRSVLLRPSDAWRDDPEFEAPHRRGEIIVAAVMQTLIKIWTNRLQGLIQRGVLNAERAAEEGAKSAAHLLNMVIRALDYTPPAAFEFEDFLDAIIVSDTVLVPEDDRKYRQSLQESFKAFGIFQPFARTVNVSEERLLYENLNFNALRVDRDEAYRFIWQNADILDIRRDFYTRVDQVVPTVRVGPDGFVVAESVVRYFQELECTGAELKALASGEGLSFDLPRDLDPASRIRICGAGTLIFDQFGRARHHQTKPILDYRRQQARLDYLVRAYPADSKQHYGFLPDSNARANSMQFHGVERREW